MDQGEIVVSFKLDIEEARRQTADLKKYAGVTKVSIRMQWSVAILYLALGVLDLATNRHAGIFAWIYIFAGCVFVRVALSMRKSLVGNVPAGVETTIRFSVAQIVIERPAPQTLPWSAVESVSTYDGSIALHFLASEIRPPLEQRILIPKDALPDDGSALWHLSEQMLLGPLRRVSAQMLMDETGALRRTDAVHIRNVRACRASRKRTPLPTQSVTWS